MKSIHSREECHFGTTFSYRYSLQTSVSNCTIRTRGFYSLTVYIDRKETHLYVPLIVITCRSESPCEFFIHSHHCGHENAILLMRGNKIKDAQHPRPY